ncbi:MAG: TonB-dependent receptor [Dechloromonas sp.]|uniref:TonB-dependent receptor n=1 Tax=Candidatus Dechloromonas phosphorivorans TaxID=2899244 RepID=A0A935K3H3_9RHOO|nr:TonB-dependent receptor [Candidatus Dechloromonas phosphorivorans]
MQQQFRLSPVAMALLGVLGSLGNLSAQAEETKELSTVNVSGARDLRVMPLDVPASTGSRLGTTIKEIPASIDVISQETMQERGDRTMVEAVSKVAGLNGARVGASHVGFSARGFIENGVTWLYNGVRVPGGSNMSSRILDTANYDRIEVLRGPASVLNGEGGTGATVNLISRAPSFAAQPFEIDYAYSSYNSHRLHVGKGGAIKDDAVAYRADISTNRFGSYVDGERGALDRFTGSLLFKLSDTLKLTLELDKMRDDVNDFYYGTPLVNGKIERSLRRINYNNLTDNIYASNTTWLRGNLEWQATPDFEVRNQMYYYDSYRNWRDVSEFRYNASAKPTVTRFSWGDIDHDHQLIGNRLEGLLKGKIGGLDNRFLIGADINRTEFKSERNGFPGTQTVDAYNPPSVNFNTGTRINKSLAREVSINQWSLFTEDQLSLTKEFKLIGGLRHDRFQTDWTYHDQAGSPKESKTHNFNSWRVGAVYDLTPNTTFYASYATAVEPGGTLFVLNRNQSQLDLTTAKQFEIGVKQGFWGNKGEWTAAIYDIEKKNVFVPDPAKPTNRLPVGQQSSQGIELSLGLRPTQHWQIDGNIAYVHARYDEYSTGNPPVSLSGNTPRLVPQWMANLGVQFMPTAAWSFGSWVRHVDKAYINDANTLELPSYTTLDLSADYKVSKALDVGFRVRNATDELYAESAYGNTQVLIANPRTYELSLRMKF